VAHGGHFGSKSRHFVFIYFYLCLTTQAQHVVESHAQARQAAEPFVSRVRRKLRTVQSIYATCGAPG